MPVSVKLEAADLATEIDRALDAAYLHVHNSGDCSTVQVGGESTAEGGGPGVPGFASWYVAFNNGCILNKMYNTYLRESHNLHRCSEGDLLVIIYPR